MTKRVLLSRVFKSLLDKGYRVVDCEGIQSSFDLIARQDDHILVIKILSNIEGLTRASADELKHISDTISGKPVVIGYKKKDSMLLNDTMYNRCSIPVVNPKTFENILADIQPSVYSIRGNYCKRIKPDMLVRLRHRKKMTQHDLADKLGVSKQSVYRYESSGHVSLEIAKRLADIFLDDKLATQADIFEEVEQVMEVQTSARYMSNLIRRVEFFFKNIGFSTSITNAPFDMIAKEKKMIFSAISNDKKGIKRKITVLESMSEITGAYPLCITERRVDIDTKTIKPSDLEDIKTPKQLFKVIVE